MDRRRQSLLVLRRQKGEVQRDGNRLWLDEPELVHDPHDLAIRQSLDDLSKSVDPLRHLDDVPPVDDRLRLGLDERVSARPQLVADFQHIGRPLSRDERNLGAAPHQESIGRHGESVNEQSDVLGCDGCGPANPFDAGCDGRGAAPGARGYFVDVNPACRLIDQDQVGKRAADIGRESDHRMPMNPSFVAETRSYRRAKSTLGHHSIGVSSNFRAIGRLSLGKSLTGRLRSSAGRPSGTATRSPEARNLRTGNAGEHGRKSHDRGRSHGRAGI